MLISDNLPPRVYITYRRQLDQLQRAIECASSMTTIGPSSGTAAKFVAAGMLARSVSLAESAYNLFCLGYENAVVIVVRSLTELAIDCAYIWTTDTEGRAESYIRHATVAGIKLAEALSDGEARIAEMVRLGVLPPEVHSLADAKKWAKQAFGSKLEWTTLALPDRARQADVLKLYDLMYRLGCTETHSNMMALPISVRDVSSKVVTTGAAMPSHPAWIGGAALALLVILSKLVEVLGGDESKVQALADELARPLAME